MLFLCIIKSSVISHVSNDQIFLITGADPEFFQGGGVEEENFERKMIVDTYINMCTH